MKTCKNCFWYEHCKDKAKERCEYYYPLHGNIVQSEYNAAVRERYDTYEEISEEFED